MIPSFTRIWGDAVTVKSQVNAGNVLVANLSATLAAIP
jgi:hypothetical protein